MEQESNRLRSAVTCRDVLGKPSLKPICCFPFLRSGKDFLSPPLFLRTAFAMEALSKVHHVMRRAIFSSRIMAPSLRSSSSNRQLAVQYNTGDGYIDYDHTLSSHADVDGTGKLAVIFAGFGFTKRQVRNAIVVAERPR